MEQLHLSSAPLYLSVDLGTVHYDAHIDAVHRVYINTRFSLNVKSAYILFKLVRNQHDSLFSSTTK